MSRFTSVCLCMLIVLGAMFVVKPAHAACTASVSALNFGNINPVNPGVLDVSASVDYTCSSLISVLSYIKVCIEIGPGPQDSSVNDRMMTHTTISSDKLAYNIYADPARTQVIGNAYGSGSPPVILQHGPYTLTLLATATGKQNVYGRIAASNAFIQRSVGQYNSSLTVTVRMSVVTLVDLLPCSLSNPAVIQMPVTAQLLSACKINATPLNFGSHPSNFSTSVLSTSAIDSSCTKNTPYQIGLSNGLYANGNQRRMRTEAGQYINYELYQNAARTQRWGSALNTAETLAGTATGISQKATVYGKVDPQAGLEAANYKDTVTVTITY